jgi:hypothetical protein
MFDVLIPHQGNAHKHIFDRIVLFRNYATSSDPARRRWDPKLFGEFAAIPSLAAGFDPFNTVDTAVPTGQRQPELFDILSKIDDTDWQQRDGRTASDA